MCAPTPIFEICPPHKTPPLETPQKKLLWKLVTDFQVLVTIVRKFVSICLKLLTTFGTSVTIFIWKLVSKTSQQIFAKFGAIVATGTSLLWQLFHLRVCKRWFPSDGLGLVWRADSEHPIFTSILPLSYLNFTQKHPFVHNSVCSQFLEGLFAILADCSQFCLRSF